MHTMAFPDSFLTGLGSYFLSVYYCAILKSRDGLIVGIHEANVLQGFASGSVRSDGFNSRLVLSNMVEFVPIIIYLAVFRFPALLRLFRNLSKGELHKDSYQVGELASLCVRPVSQGKSYGRVLLQEFISESRRLGVQKLALTTDALENERVIKFYKSAGFNAHSSFVSYGDRPMLKFERTL